MILKNFAQKFGEKIAFLTQIKAKLCKMLIITGHGMETLGIHISFYCDLVYFLLSFPLFLVC
jgi:hypothetical protein